MRPIVNSPDELIGETPLLRLRRLLPSWHGELFAKLEWFNPSGSDKDRVVRQMLTAAQVRDELPPDGTIIEATSGNIAFALASQGVPQGYRVILVMPEIVPRARIQLLRALGAEVVLTPTAEGMPGAERHARELAQLIPNAFLPNQFQNPVGRDAYTPLADELWHATEGRLDVVVAAVSTGSTISGMGHRLRALSAGHTRIIAVEPAASPVLSGGSAGRHELFGMGPPFIPANYEADVVDEVLAVSQQEVQETLLRLYRREGVLSGPAGGASLAAALRLTARADLSDARIVAILPDTMERYAGMRFWQEDPLLSPEVIE